MMLTAAEFNKAAGVPVEISLRNEADLRAYFALSLPPAPGASSGFGPMCERVANLRNPATTEVPSPDASWTEIVHCSSAADVMTDGEDGFIAYVDARWRVRRVHDVVVRLTTRDASVLFAHYSRAPRPAGPFSRIAEVAALTETAVAENRRRAASGRHESIMMTLDSLAADLTSRKLPKSERDSVRTQVHSIQREAKVMLQAAHASYAQVREEMRSWR